MTSQVPAIAVVARSGTGKTTLVEKVIRELRARGRRVGAIKHDAHDFEIDRPGKDSARFTAAGAEVTVIASDAKVAMIRITADPVELDRMLSEWFLGMDVVIVEGYKTSDLPKLEVHRPELGRPLLTRGDAYDDHLLAVASTGPVEVDVPVLDANDPACVAGFLEREVLGTHD
ncbi:MAG: molybdopterin-guanine dinucleotide biosynthesis protein B [bacterium]|nr:molybdopterin-guanine dinucleotide biosynthesis protein B [bacterium]